MSDILFGQSYFLKFDPKLWDAMQPYPPLGTLYAASYARARGYDVRLFDAMLADSEADWRAALARHRPTYAVLYEDNFNYLSKMCLSRMRQAAFAMIAMAREAGATVIVCGSDASDHADAYLDSGAGYVIVGEGEHTLGELLDHLSGRAAPAVAGIAGLVMRDASGATLRTGRRPDIRDLDALPFPAWDLVDVGRYRERWQSRHGRYSMNMVTTRGCPYHCNWCAKPIWGQRYNARSPDNVALELAWLKQTFRPDHIWFADDIFGLKPGWLERFASRVEALDARLAFKCLSRVDLLVKPNDVDALRRAGCETIWVGAESGSQKILDAMDKGTRVEQIYQATRRLQDAGIRVAFFLQFGYPGETREDIDKTLQMVRDLAPDDVGFSVSYPLPGTPFFASVQGQLGEKQNWVNSSDLDTLYRGPFSNRFYRRLHQVLHKEFRARKSWRELRLVARTPSSLAARHLRQAAAMLYRALTLPVDRVLLELEARAHHAGVGPLQQSLSHEAAAAPSPQND